MVFQRTVLVIMNTDMKNSAVFTTVQINQRHCPAEISIAVQLELESVSNSTGIHNQVKQFVENQRPGIGPCGLVRVPAGSCGKIRTPAGYGCNPESNPRPRSDVNSNASGPLDTP